MSAAMRGWLVAIIALGVGCADESERKIAGPPAPPPDKVLDLPKGLKEVSGLAAASDSSVYAHNDEYGVVYEISTDDGAVLKAFALGDPTVRADFEGIAISQGRLYLLTSNGRIFEAPIGEHGERVFHNVYDTGLRDICEFEGLAADVAPGAFFLLCKRSAAALPARSINIYRWSLADDRPPTAPWKTIPLDNALTDDQAVNFRPSAIERRADGGLIIVSAANSMMVEVTADGTVVRTEVLGKAGHPQAEGVTIIGSGDLIIADEGARSGRGRISIYKAKK